MDILELKNTTTPNFKSQWVRSTAEQKGGEKETMNLQIEQQRFPSLNNREKIGQGEKKWAEPQGPMRLTKAITFISSEFWKMRKKTGIKTILIEIWLKTSV